MESGIRLPGFRFWYYYRLGVYFINFSHPENEDNNTTYLSELFQEFSKLIWVKCVELCLAYGVSNEW